MLKSIGSPFTDSWSSDISTAFSLLYFLDLDAVTIVLYNTMSTMSTMDVIEPAQVRKMILLKLLCT